jgi:hypothetical protein
MMTPISRSWLSKDRKRLISCPDPTLRRLRARSKENLATCKAGTKVGLLFITAGDEQLELVEVHRVYAG